MRKLVFITACVMLLVMLGGCRVAPKREQGYNALDSISQGSAEPEAPSIEPSIEVSKELTAAELEDILSKQNACVVGTTKGTSTSYLPLLVAKVKNNTDKDIQSCVMAYAAWDENGLPIKIEVHTDFNNPEYMKTCTINEANIIPGEILDNRGLVLEYQSKVGSFKAIVVSYKTFDGETWTNPYYSDWTRIYEGKKL